MITARGELNNFCSEGRWRMNSSSVRKDLRCIGEDKLQTRTKGV